MKKLSTIARWVRLPPTGVSTLFRFAHEGEGRHWPARREHPESRADLRTQRPCPLPQFNGQRRPYHTDFLLLAT
jgi:hypothetical protein